MLSLIETFNYCCFKYLSQPLSPINVLTGPHGSGKTLFLDTLSFLNRLVREDPESAVYERAGTFQDLTWRRGRSHFELAVEAEIPEAIRRQLSPTLFDHIRYEVSVGLDDEDQIAILAEKGLLRQRQSASETQQKLFPQNLLTPASILMSPRSDRRWIFNKKPGGNDNYYSEVQKKGGGGWRPSFKLGPRKSAFGNLPQEQSLFPAATWFKEFLTQDIKTVTLNERLLKRPCSPGQTTHLKPNAANLPIVVKDLKIVAPQQFEKWIAMLKTVLPDIENIHIKEQQDTYKIYLTLAYRSGVEVPSWMLSGGTLRLLALTLPAFLKDTKGIYIYKNPENGLHRDGIKAVFDALTSIHSAQVFISTHSPVLLNAASFASVFCFEKNEQGASEIVPGSVVR